MTEDSLDSDPELELLDEEPPTSSAPSEEASLLRLLEPEVLYDRKLKQ